MESSRSDGYAKTEYADDCYENALVLKAIQGLVNCCQNYNDNQNDDTDGWRKLRNRVFGNVQDLPAKHVIKELNFLDNHCRRITPKHQLPFRSVVLKGYIIALQEYLPKKSRLSIAVDNFVHEFFPNQTFDDVKQAYREEIDQIKQYFSSPLFRQSAYQYCMESGVDVFYSAYKKYNSDVHTFLESEVELNLLKHNN